MRMSAREKKITPSSGNVFSDLGFDDAEYKKKLSK